MTTETNVNRYTGLIRVRRRNSVFLRLVGTMLIGAFSFQCVAPAYAVSSAVPYSKASPNDARATAPAGAKRAFARTAKKGRFDIQAIKESGEHGGGLTPTTEDLAKFTAAGNEAFGACMQLWNGHRWEKAAAAMKRFAAKYPRDPWRGEALLHLACYHYFRGEYTEAEDILAPLYEQNRDNAIGRKSLVRLGRVYFDTFRHQAAGEVFSTLLRMDPTENENSFAVNWLFHVSRSWMYAAEARECGPKAFGYAAWLMDHAEQTRAYLEADRIRSGSTRARSRR